MTNVIDRIVDINITCNRILTRLELLSDANNNQHGDLVSSTEHLTSILEDLRTRLERIEESQGVIRERMAQATIARKEQHEKQMETIRSIANVTHGELKASRAQASDAVKRLTELAYNSMKPAQPIPMTPTPQRVPARDWYTELENKMAEMEMFNEVPLGDEEGYALEELDLGNAYQEPVRKVA